MTREQLTRENEMLLRQNAELRVRVEALEKKLKARPAEEHKAVS